MKIFFQQRGQAAIESLISSFLVIFIFFAGSGVMYMAFAKIWLNHRLYEAVICYAEGTNRTLCEKNGRDLSSQTLTFGKINYLKLTRSPWGWNGELIWQLKTGVKLHLRRQIKQVELNQSAKEASSFFRL